MSIFARPARLRTSAPPRASIVDAQRVGFVFNPATPTTKGTP